MENCLVKTLKGEATNNSLVGIGEMLVHIKANNSDAQRQIKFANSAGYVKVVGGGNKIASVYYGTVGQFTNYIQIPTDASGRTIAFAAGEYDIIIGNKYNITNFNLFGKYDNQTTSGQNSPLEVTLDINDLMSCSGLKEISCYSVELKGIFDIKKLSSFNEVLSVINMRDCTGAGIVGDINVFSNFEFSTIDPEYILINLANNIGVYGSKSTLPNTIPSSKVHLEGTSCTE